MKFKKDLIEKLREGKIAAINDGTLEQLRKVLCEAFPEDALSETSSGTYRLYESNWGDEWVHGNNTILPKVSVKDFFEKGFILPEKWCVKVTEETVQGLIKLRKESGRSKPSDIKEYSYAIFNSTNRSSDNFGGNHDPVYTEITTEQFIKHVLKMETKEEKIIGYKLVKPEYYIEVNNIMCINNNNYEGLKRQNTLISELGFLSTTSKKPDSSRQSHLPFERLKKSGVLDLWFEKVYEDEFKIGDIVFDKEQGLAKIVDIEYNNFYFENDWSKAKGTRLTSKDSIIGERMRKATPQEIEEYNNRNRLPKINGYEGRIENNKLIYGCAQLSKKWFNSSDNRHIKSMVLDSGVKVNEEQMNQIRKYFQNES